MPSAFTTFLWNFSSDVRWPTITNLLLDPLVQQAVHEKEIDWLELIEQEPDAGRGNGGLGRLAACFLDSMATMQLPAIGYGLRYEYGMFRQTFENGWQRENPDNWLRDGDPWEICRAHEKVEIKLNCTFKLKDGHFEVIPNRPSCLFGIPFDRPVAGYGGKTGKRSVTNGLTDLSQLRSLRSLAGDPGLQKGFRASKGEAKTRFADWLNTTSGQIVDPDSIFDCQIKRIHEYKRQLLNALRIIVCYDRLRQNPNMEMVPRTFFFAGKAAPTYQRAKLIIKFINNLEGTIDGDPIVRRRMKVVFLPEYNVSLAERLIPASDVSNQISTAGYEASGTSNMKFMMNGALTVGTWDGATIEMAEEAGEGNLFLFGLTVEQVENSQAWYNPHWHYEHEPETRAALDLIFSDYFSRYEPGAFAPLRDTLLTNGDHYMHLADLTSYCQAQDRLGDLYANPNEWARKAILNVASSGKFSSDRTIHEYATEIWKAEPCPIL